jgi:hypothetical protein
MGQPSQSGPSITGLSTQHERLILELLPFKDASQFHEWLHSPYVLGSWREFHADFLSSASIASTNGLIPEPDKNKTSQAAKDAISSKTAKFLMYHPDKRDWSPQDHHVRFIATVVVDNMLKGLWSDSDWKKRGGDITKAVYEVLSFLRAAMVKNEYPPRYEA